MIYIVIAVVACCVISYFVDKKISPNKDTEAKADVQESSEPIVKTPEEEFISKIEESPIVMLPYIVRYFTCEVVKGYYSDVETINACEMNRKYLTNAFAFKNRYEGKVFAIEDTLTGIEANNNKLILTFGDGKYYRSEDGTQSHSRNLRVIIYSNDLNDPDYQKSMENLRTGDAVLLVGVLIDSSIGFTMNTGRILSIKRKSMKLIKELAIAAYRETSNSDSESET